MALKYSPSAAVDKSKNDEEPIFVNEGMDGNKEPDMPEVDTIFDWGEHAGVEVLLLHGQMDKQAYTIIERIVDFAGNK